MMRAMNMQVRDEFAHRCRNVLAIIARQRPLEILHHHSAGSLMRKVLESLSCK